MHQAEDPTYFQINPESHIDTNLHALFGCSCRLIRIPTPITVEHNKGSIEFPLALLSPGFDADLRIRNIVQDVSKPPRNVFVDEIKPNIL
jgi:hypothetical protein